MATDINLLELRKVTNAILDHIIEDLEINKLPLKDTADFYWEVPSERLYTVHEEQPQLDVGRLSDDLEFLSIITQDKQQAVALMLSHLAPILRYIGEEIGE
jgi:hypothetical protein